MQKWWIGVVGVAAVVLAVLLIGSPDTGADVNERELTVPEATDGDGSGDELVRSEHRKNRSPAAVPLDENGQPLPKGSPMAANPKARAVMLRRQAPESQWAARTMAPWTQIRREVAKQDPEAPLIETVQSLLDEMRALRRDPATRDFDTIMAQQAEAVDAVRASGKVNAEIESMLTLIDSRQASYEAGEYEPGAIEAAKEAVEHVD